MTRQSLTKLFGLVKGIYEDAGRERMGENAAEKNQSRCSHGTVFLLFATNGNFIQFGQFILKKVIKRSVFT